MLPQSGLATAAQIPVDIRRFPWINRLAADYAFAYGQVSDFYAGDPRSREAWRTAIARTRACPRPGTAVADVIGAQQARRGAPAAAVTTANLLRRPETVAVVTGQQAGLFGGPLFTLLKALTAIRLAERIRVEERVPAVPVFWVDAEDHDWDEVKGCGLLDAEMQLRHVSIGHPAGANEGSVARVGLDETIEEAIEELQRVLPATEFTPALLSSLREAYQPGIGMADAFARWLEATLGPLGLVVYDASDVATKPLVAQVFARELEHAGETSRAAIAAGAALKARGYHAQVSPVETSACLFHLGHGREGVQVEGDAFRVGDRVESREALIEEARRAPEHFSPNVLLRPIIQDSLFPTVAYVSGPSELAYLGQLRAVYDAFGVPMPLVFQRASATLVDSNALRFLTKHEVPLAALRPQDEAALNALLEAQLPPAIEQAVTAVGEAIRDRMEAVAREVTQVDPTLEGATRSTLGRMDDDLRKLHGKIIQAAKRKDETLRRQFTHAQRQAFPGGHPQEREIGFVGFLNKYGPGLVERLSEELTLDMGTHWIIVV